MRIRYNAYFLLKSGVPYKWEAQKKFNKIDQNKIIILSNLLNLK
jgi:hypothetical protein